LWAASWISIPKQTSKGLNLISAESFAQSRAVLRCDLMLIKAVRRQYGEYGEAQWRF